MNNLSSYVPVSETFGALEFPTFKKFAWSVHDHVIPHERNNYHPHVLSHRFLALLSILVITIKVASISFVVLSPASISEATAISSETIVSLANTARVENGLGQLTPNSLLSKAAQNKANDMLARQYFAHNTPDGLTPWTFIKAVGYSYSTAGENLAIDFTQAENVQTAWMNSPGHRANILNGSFQEIGIGIAKGTYDNHETTIVVQMFGTPLNTPVALQEKPTPVAQPAPAPTPVATSAPVVVPSTQEVSQSPVSQTPVAQPVTEVQHVSLVENQNPIPVPLEVNILDTKTSLQGNNLYLEVQTTDNAVKVLAFYGERSIMLDPLEGGIWKGMIPLSSIDNYNNLTIQVQDINGGLHQTPVAQFSQDLNHLDSGNVEGAQVTIFGTSFNPKVWEENTLLLILAGIITALIIAIAVKRHVQHLSLVANTSFVAMLIAMLLLV